MNVVFDLKLGVSALPTYSTVLPLTGFNVSQTGSHVGSNHIQSLDLHYQDYVDQQDWKGFPHLAKVPPFPYQSAFPLVLQKKPSADVTGTLGEGVAAIGLRALARLQTTSIVTLDISHTAKTPDFAAELPPTWLSNLSIQVPQTVSFPRWWPVEVKATQFGGKKMDDAAWRGFRQLVSYWRRIRQSSMADIGFGVVFVFKYANLKTSPPRACAYVFLPLKQLDLMDALKSSTIVSKAKSALKDQGIIHGV